MRTLRFLPLLIVTAFAARADSSPPAKIAPTFEQHVRPILKAHCVECHGEGKKLKGGLDLRLRRFLVAGGDKGPAVVPGKPNESSLYQRVRDHQMPPGKVKLSTAEVERIKEWIAAGAHAIRVEPEKLPPGIHITDDDRTFWSFQTIRRPDVPAVRNDKHGLLRTPIDAFVLARLEASGLTLSPEADRVTFIRRATL